MTRRYVPPPADNDASLDEIEEALVRMFVAIIVDEIRSEMHGETTEQPEDSEGDPCRRMS